MAFDFNKLKQQLTSGKLFSRKTEQELELTPTENAAVAPVQPAQPATGLAAEMKRGVEDIKTVASEGNYKLFVKQLVAVLLVFLGVRYLNDKLTQQQAVYKDQVAAISIQQTNEEDYLDNKARLLQLEPLFPDMSNKNEWLLRKIMDVLEEHSIQAKIDGNVKENASTNYTVLTQPVTFQQEFMEFGKFLADIENGDDFLRISELSITKMTDPASLGKNTITMQFNTLFPKAKYGPKLFKDYAQQMQKIKAAQEKEASAKMPATAAEETKNAQ